MKTTIDATQPTVSVVFATKGRKEFLRRALASVFRQQGVGLEVIVMDDASEDGTPEMVRTEFPTVQLHTHAVSRGVAVRRTEGARFASAPFIFSIDDDAEYSSPNIIRATLSEFDHPRIGAVAIPHIDILVGPKPILPTPPAEGRWVVSAFVGTSYAVRREVFLSVGGYRSILVHSTEERDFCVRMLNRGWVTRLGRAEPVHHFSSAIRNAWVARMLERRNDICHAVWDVPFPDFLYHFPGTILSGLGFAVKNHCLTATVTGYLKAPATCWQGWAQRSRLSPRMYRLLRRLNRAALLPLEEIEPELPPLPESSPLTPADPVYA